MRRNTLCPRSLACNILDIPYRAVTLKEVGFVEDGDLVSLSDLIKAKVFDGEGEHIGHLQDLAIEDLSSPDVTYLGTHVFWTDRVRDVELVRPVEDIVLLLPWSQVESFDEDGFRLLGIHPDFPVETAEGRLLLRADLLDKQILDSKGNRIQRVDDIYICLLYTSDAADDLLCVDLGGRRIIKKKKKHRTT